MKRTPKSNRRGEDLALALELADLAKGLAMESFAGPHLGLETKSDGSPVTAVDRAIELAIRRRLEEERPNDSVIGEEYGRSGSGRREWMIDPIDGTGHYAQGTSEWATLIALVDGGLPVVGVVSRPAQGKRWWAAEGEGAYADGLPIRVSQANELSSATIADDYRFTVARSLTSNPLHGLADQCAAVRDWTDVFDTMRLARGRIDLIFGWYAGNGPDLAPSVAIVHEAGGRFSDLEGRVDIHAPVNLWSNGHLHDEALAAVRKMISDGLADPSSELKERSRGVRCGSSNPRPTSSILALKTHRHMLDSLCGVGLRGDRDHQI